MKEEIEFNGRGKNSSYKVPEGFFETISQRTLQKIKQREQRRRKIFLLSKFTAAAASLLVLISLAFLITGPQSQNKQQASEQRIDAPQSRAALKSGELVGEKSVTQNKNEKEKKIVPVKRNEPAIKEDEKIDEVLADLSEEDLQMLATLYKADPFHE